MGRGWAMGWGDGWAAGWLREGPICPLLSRPTRIDTCITFDGIDGESTQVDHQGEIELLSWRWGLGAPAGTTAGTGGAGAATGKARARERHGTHTCDKASPLLAKTAAQSKRIKTAVLSARANGDGQKDFLKITLKDVLITSVRISAGHDSAVVEGLSLAFSAITIGHKPQQPTGALGAATQQSRWAGARHAQGGLRTRPGSPHHRSAGFGR